MKHSSRRTRATADLSDSVHRLLNLYALTAGAAGVSLLALDLNHDHVRDFRFFLNSFQSRMTYLFSLNVAGANSPYSDNAIWYTVSNNLQCAAALPKGTEVGPKSPLLTRNSPWMFINEQTAGTLRGCPWLHVTKQAYLGLRFTIKGLVHYGWARLGYISANHRSKAKLTGYAYETIPNKPIVTGKTKDSENENIEAPNASLTTPAPVAATLGALAVGASVLSIWRREELVGAAQ
jgi:hypothetical protein